MCARLTRSVRLDAPACRSILAMCWATVYLLMCSLEAICTLVRPSETSWRIVKSLGVNRRNRAAEGSPAGGLTSTSVMLDLHS